MDNMAIRKIKDAKDLSDNSLIYFKGHAKATYMSNGSTVEDAINNIKFNSGGNLSNIKIPIIRTTINNEDYYVDVDTKTYITCEGSVNIFLN
jgi:hypothetical protein